MPTASGEAVLEAALETVASRPGIGRRELAEAMRRRTGIPVAAAVTRIRELERRGVLPLAADGEGYEMRNPADSRAVTSPVEPRTPGPRSGSEPATVETHGAGRAQAEETSGAQATGSPPTVVRSEAHREEVPAPEPTNDELVRLLAGGDRAACRRYRQGRESAVYAYCLRVSALDAVPAAIEATFASVANEAFHAKPQSVEELDAILLQAVRAEAAQRVPRSPRRRGLRRTAEELLGRRPDRDVCEVMPKLLAALANGRLSSGEERLVRGHLAACRDCQVLEARIEKAQRAFADRMVDARRETGGR